MGEYEGTTGEAIEETAWLENMPVVVLTGGTANEAVYYVHPDHIGAPVVINDGSGVTVWSWDHDPFGNGAPSGSFRYDLRFPG